MLHQKTYISPINSFLIFLRKSILKILKIVRTTVNFKLQNYNINFLSKFQKSENLVHESTVVVFLRMSETKKSEQKNQNDKKPRNSKIQMLPRRTWLTSIIIKIIPKCQKIHTKQRFINQNLAGKLISERL